MPLLWKRGISPTAFWWGSFVKKYMYPSKAKKEKER
jgi:hypothetical protein